MEVNEAGRPGIPLHNYLPEELAAVLPISMGPEAEQRMQSSRVAILGGDVQGVVPARVLCVHVRAMRKKVRHTLCVTRRPANHATPFSAAPANFSRTLPQSVLPCCGAKQTCVMIYFQFVRERQLSKEACHDHSCARGCHTQLDEHEPVVCKMVKPHPCVHARMRGAWLLEAPSFTPWKVRPSVLSQMSFSKAKLP